MTKPKITSRGKGRKPQKAAQRPQEAQSREPAPTGAPDAPAARTGEHGPSDGQLAGQVALDVDQALADSPAPVLGPDDMEPPENDPAPVADGTEVDG